MRLFVQDNGDGTFSVVKTDDGQNFEVLYIDADLNKAQDWLNAYVSQQQPGPSVGGGQLRTGPGPGTSLTGPGASKTGPGANFDWDSFFQAIMNSNGVDMQWAKDKFGQELAEKIRQFNSDLQERQRQFDQESQLRKDLAQLQSGTSDRQLYSSLMQSLLSGAAQLRGPENWQQYANYTSGGKDIFKAMFGDQTVAAFSAPTGYSRPMDIQTLLQQLGVRQIPEAGALPPAANITTGNNQQTTSNNQSANDPSQLNTTLDYIWSKRPDLATFYRNNGWNVDSPEQQRRAVQDWLRFAPEGHDPYQVARGLGWNPPQPATQPGTQLTTPGIVSTPAAQLAQPAALGIASMGATPNTVGPAPGGGFPGSAIGPTTGAAPGGQNQVPPAPAPSMVPLPFHINPMTWDSMSDVQKQVILSAAEAGRTETGAWDAADFLRQFEASRPKGQAPRMTSFRYKDPSSLYGSF